MRAGYIYLITNKNDGKQYVGQTVRDIYTRFYEHCYDDRSTSKIHKAIKEEGASNFKIELLETVVLEQLDEREQYWISTLQTRDKGYNVAVGGRVYPKGYWKKVKIIENGLIFDSREEMGRIISTLTSWGHRFLTTMLKRCIDNNKPFLDYHLTEVDNTYDTSDIIDLENWVRTLSVRYNGKHIYCEELDMEFETIAEAAKYLLDNGLYITQSKTPLQSLVTSIGKVIHGKNSTIKGKDRDYTFISMPGTTKQKGANEPWKSVQVYCPELDKTFPSQTAAANYMIDNQIWTGIKVKTAKLRISDIVRGAFPNYKGYTFRQV